MKNWDGFKKGEWKERVNVRDFIQLNYKPYEEGDGFLEDISEKTKKLWDKAENLINEEILTGEIKICTSSFSGIDNHAPGYLDKENELIVGYQTEEPLKRIVNPYGGYRMVQNSLDSYNAKMDSIKEETFNEYRKTHNEGVFDAYTGEMR
ncbi:MAG: pyruvate formate lyase family protein, partial [Tissierella sp.]|uniref:pyruvate formate lyase family protein n=1 Tax=Tissierella sp. TaxID=41274 RepID=UPI003F9DB109